MKNTLLPNLNSVQDVFAHPYLQGTTRAALFRLKSESNAELIQQGITRWWPIANKERTNFDSIILLHNAKDTKFVEVWAGLYSGDFELNEEKELSLKVHSGFKLIGNTKKHGINTFCGKQIGDKVTYIDRNTAPNKTPTKSVSPSFTPKFNPEFAGNKQEILAKGYKPSTDHGNTLNALANWLRSNRYSDLDNCGGDWDLLALNTQQNLCLFELKSSADTTSVYTAIGQLLIYSQKTYQQPDKKIIVLPDDRASSVWQIFLKPLEIDILLYKKTSKSVEFRWQHKNK